MRGEGVRVADGGDASGATVWCNVAAHRVSPGEASAGGPSQPGLRRDLARWVAAGLLSDRQSAAILAHEAAVARPVPSATAAPLPSTGRRRIPAVAEALGYLGGILAMVGLALVVAEYWPDMELAGRLALSGAGAVVFVGAGALVHEEVDPALARLRGFLWLAATAATALFAGVLTADGFDAERAETVALVCGGAVALESALLWAWRERPLQQLAMLGGFVVFAGAAVAEVTSSGAVGLTVWILGAFFLFLGLRRRTPLALLTEATGGLTVVVGAVITSADWPGFGLVLGVGTACGLLALAVVRGLAPTRADQLLTGVIGGLALLEAAPSTLGYFSRDAGVVTGLTTWLVGGALVFVGSRRLVRLGLVVEVLGGLALVGGAALTGVEAPGFASILGIVTALGLVVLGTLPGQVLLSLLGSLGLLINVLWAIGWFFPGEGRAPLLVMVSGLLILAIAVLLTRRGGRFRRELRRPGHDASDETTAA